VAQRSHRKRKLRDLSARGRKRMKRRESLRKSGIFSMKRLSSRGLLKTYTNNLASSLSINMLTKRLSSFRLSLVLYRLKVKSIRISKIKLENFKLGHTLATLSVKSKDVKLLNLRRMSSVKRVPGSNL